MVSMAFFCRCGGCRPPLADARDPGANLSFVCAGEPFGLAGRSIAAAIGQRRAGSWRPGPSYRRVARMWRGGPFRRAC